MKVRVELHAVLRDLLPNGKGEVEIPDGASLSQLLDMLGIDEQLRELVTLNGTQVFDLDATPVADNDVVSVFPAVAGGASVRSPYVDEGVRLFNEGEYFLAHETLEEHWVDAPKEQRDFLQGLIHLAVGMLHRTKGNTAGMTLQFKKAQNRLRSYSSLHDGVDLDAIRDFLARALKAAEDQIAPPRL